MPALFTSASSRPNSANVASIILWRSAALATSIVCTSARRPIARSSAATASARPACRSATTTCMPSLARRSAIARPIPCPAPVTIATWPATGSSIDSSPNFFTDSFSAGCEGRAPFGCPALTTGGKRRSLEGLRPPNLRFQPAETQSRGGLAPSKPPLSACGNADPWRTCSPPNLPLSAYGNEDSWRACALQTSAFSLRKRRSLEGLRPPNLRFQPAETQILGGLAALQTSRFQPTETRILGGLAPSKPPLSACGNADPWRACALQTSAFSLRKRRSLEGLRPPNLRFQPAETQILGGLAPSKPPLSATCVQFSWRSAPLAHPQTQQQQRERSDG